MDARLHNDHGSPRWLASRFTNDRTDYWNPRTRIFMTPIHSVAVFCGSRVGVNPAYAEAGRVLGHGLGRAGMRLVYGGGRVGIMGVVADAVLAVGGTVVGVIPEFLTKWEVAHTNVSEMIVTDSMHSRKRRLYEEADAFVVMPGGLGT